MGPVITSRIEPLADENIAYGQDQSVLFEQSLVDTISPSQTFRPPSQNAATRRWRPIYLRRSVLFGFILVFILIIVTIEVLLSISNRNQGLATSTSAQHYLWTYGPTAFLTGVATLWARTEYQSKLIAPWLRLSQNPAPASRTLLLDYVSQFSFFAIFTSLKNRDFTVAISTTVSIILKLLIIISTSLISLSWTTLHQDSYPMSLRDKFVDNTAKLSTTGDLAVYIVQGARDQNLTLPEGISSEYAFQSVQTNLPDEVETTVVVDGLVNSLRCHPANVTLLKSEISGGEAGFRQEPLNLRISSPRCNVALARLPDVEIYGNSSLFARFQQIQCDEISDDPGKRVIVMFGNITKPPAISSRSLSNTNSAIQSRIVGYTTSILSRSTSLLCTPQYAIDKVRVTRNSTRTRSVSRVIGKPRTTLDSVTAWNIMEAQFEAGRADLNYVGPYSDAINVSTTPVNVDPYMFTALKSQLEPGSRVTDLFEIEVLQKVATNYYQAIGAVIAKQSLMVPTSVGITGSATLNKSRLIVRSWIAQWMVALAGFCIILISISLFLVPAKGFLPCSPTTFPNLISTLVQSRQLAAQLRFAGASDTKHLVDFLRKSTFQSEFIYDPTLDEKRFCIVDTDCDGNDRPNPQVSAKLLHPTILHPTSRSLLCVSVVGLIISLELLLHKSATQNGLGDVSYDTYIHYIWTAIPALLFGTLSITFAAMDFQIRTLAPYMALRKYISIGVFERLELLDMTTPIAILEEYRLGTLWALFTTAGFLLASLFTTFSAGLFQELNLPATVPLTLQPSRSFDSPSDEPFHITNTEIPSLIFEGNFTFPRFTYMDLAFVELKPTTVIPPNFDKSTVSISAVVPAVRSKMDCVLYEAPQLRVNNTALQVDGLIEVSTDSQIDFPVLNYNMDRVNTNSTYAGISYSFHPGSDVLYFWAKLDFGATPVVQHAAALACNLTFEALDVNTTFRNTAFDLDLHEHPRPLEDTVRNTSINDWNLAFHDDFDNLATIDLSPQFMDSFFSMVVTSPWAVPMSALGDPAANDDVIDAIKLHSRIILAQEVTAIRGPASESNATITEPIGPGDNDAQRTINATVTNTAGRRRIVQDEASTHILVALLATTLVLFIVGWVTSPRTDVLPRNPTTIASVLALLAGGNIFDRLPADKSVLSPEEILSVLGNSETRFWMGWGNLADEEGIQYGGENEGGVSQFGIFAVDKDDMDQD
ncbi:hypothetical protein F5B22DRAFT_124526 [Xylaria bambusicola]|uniref:uncharacterized protein n=1 Tax=Xylaria bambusicola TaxID=326684 RepID=UPI0020076848|nr:uncharacterized protein F5B22DRAFT_124526 [Xylaria bambusicola]KAI0517417.1 hypothetical protein F5B22DRAFT_124526 [Xylaria bambusicola]